MLLEHDWYPAPLPAGVSIGEAASALLGEPVVRDESRRRELFERLLPLFGRDPGAREALLQVLP